MRKGSRKNEESPNQSRAPSITKNEKLNPGRSRSNSKHRKSVQSTASSSDH